MKRFFSLYLVVTGFVLFFTGCGKTETEKITIADAALSNRDSYFYLDTAAYPKERAKLPVGVFDSGTGGLTVLDAIINFDKHNNENRATEDNGDGVRDFNSECFVYLADQANMPYGNYSAENNTPLLKEHIIKDALFLAGNKYYGSPGEVQYKEDKQPVKAIVIACNTATAYGKEDIEKFIERAGLNVPVIGVIDAGVKGALEIMDKDENGIVAIMATAGTVASEGYVKTLNNMKEKLGYTGDISSFQQAGIGLAGAIDGSSEYIDPTAKVPREEYKGPSIKREDAFIDTTILERYGFDRQDGNILFDGETANPKNIQINSVDNYISYHVTSLMEQIRKSGSKNKLKTIILGCTHYPFYMDEFTENLERLYNYKENGEYVYRPFMEKDIKLIDPAVNTAAELYTHLDKEELFNDADLSQSKFYISVPNRNNAGVKTNERGELTYDYKYHRNPGELQEYVVRVPFSKTNVPPETSERLKEKIPFTYELIKWEE